jgi:putative thioredoxin
MSGAVDLAAVRARSEAAARAANAPLPGAGGAIVDITEANFQAEALDRSFQVPVLLNLRTDRSEGSVALSASLERLAAESGGRWVLAHVDVDTNPRLVQAMQVQAVPTVLAVIGGQLVPGFAGALPDDQLREFVGALLQAAEQAGLSGAAPGADEDGQSAGATAPEPPGDPRFAAAEAALEAGDYAGAEAQYRAVLDAEPANEEARLALRQTAFLQRVEQVPADAVARADAAPSDVASQLSAADAELSGNDVDAAFARLLALLRRVGGDERDPVRDRLVEYFDLLGPDDPRVGPARRALANALF